MKSLKVPGKLVFQETHTMDSHHYITSIFDDQEAKRLNISVFGLDVDEVCVKL
jgi:hypothetical protein